MASLLPLDFLYVLKFTPPLCPWFPKLMRLVNFWHLESNKQNFLCATYTGCPLLSLLGMYMHNGFKFILQTNYFMFWRYIFFSFRSKNFKLCLTAECWWNCSVLCFILQIHTSEQMATFLLRIQNNIPRKQYWKYLTTKIDGTESVLELKVFHDWKCLVTEIVT